MEMEPNQSSSFNNNWNQPPQGGQELPGATAAMVLGIVSLVCVFILGCCYGIGLLPGLVTSIIGLVMGNKAIKLYNELPGSYEEKSFKNAKAGKIMSIIALVWVILTLVLCIVALIFGFLANLNQMDRFN